MQISLARAVVTGGGRGLGAATALMLAERGARVTILERDPFAGAQVAAEHASIRCLSVDVTDAAACAEALNHAAEGMDGLNLLVNCAGIGTGHQTLGRDGPHPLDSFRHVLDVNLTGTFNTCRLAASIMARNAPGPEGERGLIINTTSIAAAEGQKGQAAFAASKAGVAGLTLPMARDLAAHGIRCLAIAPGIFHTPLIERLGPKVLAGLAKDVVFPRRLGRAEDFAELVAMLLPVTYLNGETIRLDGGLRLHG